MHNCHLDMTETSGHRIWHKNYKPMHNTETVSQTILSEAV